MKKQKPEDPKQYEFGNVFTDHMLVADWDKNAGWAKPQILPYGPIKLSTTASSLHYGISAFEGISIVKNAKTGKP